MPNSQEKKFSNILSLIDAVIKPVLRLRMNLVMLDCAMVIAATAMGDLAGAGKLRLAGQVIQSPNLVPQDPTYGRHRRDVVLVADPLGQEPIPDLPGKYSRILLLQIADESDNLWGCHPWLTATDSSG